MEPPINRNVINERITPNTSVVSSVYTLPVFGSGRNNSKLLPRDTRISCDLVPEKLPCAACVMPVECCSVKLYKYILIVLSLILFSASPVQNKCACVALVLPFRRYRNCTEKYRCVVYVLRMPIVLFSSIVSGYLFANHHTINKFQLISTTKIVQKFNKLRIFVANEFFPVTPALNL